MNIALRKVAYDSLTPDDEQSQDYLSKIGIGSVIVSEFKKPRNYQFHKKYFALLNYAFDHWTPNEFDEPRWKGVVPQKSFERFRKDLIILAGYYEAVYRVDGSVRIEPKSIRFASMDEIEFNKLYGNTVQVVLDKILTNYTKGDLLRVMEQMEGFY